MRPPMYKRPRSMWDDGDWTNHNQSRDLLVHRIRLVKSREQHLRDLRLLCKSYFSAQLYQPERLKMCGASCAWIKACIHGHRLEAHKCQRKLKRLQYIINGGS